MIEMYNAKSGSPITTLSASIDATQTSIAVVNAGLLGTAPNIATIGTGQDAEVVKYTGITVNTLTGVTRGFEGVAKAWASGSQVARYYTAYDHDAFKENIEDNTANIATNTANIATINNNLDTTFVTHTQSESVKSLPANALDAPTKNFEAKGLSLVNIVDGKDIVNGGTVSFNSVLNDKYYDSLNETILIRTGSSMTATNNSGVTADMMIIPMTALGIEDYTEAQMLDLVRSGYIEGLQNVENLEVTTKDELETTTSTLTANVPLRRVSSGISDRIYESNGQMWLEKNVEASIETNGTVLNTTNLTGAKTNGSFVAYQTDGTLLAGIVDGSVTLTADASVQYELATPEIINLTEQGLTSGELLSFGNGTCCQSSDTFHSSDISFDVATNTGAVISGLVESANYQAKQIITKPSFLSTVEIVNVGTGGDFATINEAIAYATTKYPQHVTGTTKVEFVINLLSGFVMAEQVIVKGLNLGWIRITGEDAETVIQRSALTQEFQPLTSATPAFGALGGATLPVINQLFNMDTSGTAGAQGGVFAGETSRAILRSGSGVKNATLVGLYAVFNSDIQAQAVDFSGAGLYGIYALQSSTINAPSAKANNVGTTAAHYAVFANEGSTINFNNGEAKDCAGIGVYANNSSVINALGAVATGATSNGVASVSNSNLNIQNGNARKGSIDSGSDIFLAFGSVISANNATGGLAQTANALTSSGIIYKNL